LRGLLRSVVVALSATIIDEMKAKRFPSLFTLHFSFFIAAFCGKKRVNSFGIDSLK